MVYFDGKYVIILGCQIRPSADFPRSLKTSQHSGNKHSFWRQFYVTYFNNYDHNSTLNCFKKVLIINIEFFLIQSNVNALDCYINRFVRIMIEINIETFE